MKNQRRLAISAAALACAAGLAQAQISENFDTLPANPTPPALPGWAFQNNANPPGGTFFYQGVTTVFPAQASTGYMASNFNNSTGTGTISSFAMTPQVLLVNGQTLSFWTRTVPTVAFPDRLQVRMSTAAGSTNCGGPLDPTAVGDFTNLLLDINPTYTTTGYPNVWTNYTITLSGLPAGGVQGRFAFRYFVEGGGPAGANSDYIGIDEVTYGTIITGACCKPDGTCSLQTSSNCTNSGGTYAGDNITCAAANCPQPPTGKCCAENGSCTVVNQFVCAAASGVWGGAGTNCSVACVPFGYTETGDAGELPGTSQTVSGPAGASLNVIHGGFGAAGDTDMYQINVCNAANFSATTVGGTTIDTVMAMFKSDGKGVSFNDDEFGGTTLQSKITSQFVSPAGNGNYYIAVAGWNRIPSGATGNIWINDGVTFPYRSERAPDGPGAADSITGWNTSTSTATGNYNITFTGACFVGAAGCYPNCDNSTAPPILNALDFGCFLTKFAAGDTYANCDGSTAPPTLNALDFGCFLTKFAAGCT